MMVAALALAALCLLDTPFIEAVPLQTGPTMIVLTGMYWAARQWQLRDHSVACLCIFLVFHSIGARYIYSFVPYDAWCEAIGLAGPSELFGWERNHYDRLVHFCFGVLLVHPIATFLQDHGSVSIRRALYIAVECIIAASALYEIFEWLLTLVLAPTAAEAYNGQQGDFWDAQKDMALASLGAIIAASLIYTNIRRKERLP